MERGLAAGGGGGGGAGSWRRPGLVATEGGAAEGGARIRGGGTDEHDDTTGTGTHGESVSRRMERTTFLCWDDFEAALGEYCESTYQMYKYVRDVELSFPVRSSQTYLYSMFFLQEKEFSLY
ncbi:hypothetical protein PHYSODRAFT_301900 [Phytophthora sojae]|uniref:Uncharacterized protein n=1 Tax=Phytophthora sojae (strain P6497) TaxID=1094619 RepID=G4ZMK9_PHYSP|nr:hypothetical protein PHYSODRAFT_301900 [Phytophthora sojae]EGZ15356.1 hypothetical protein PHYSODRAFT_301900 [Phytophthora sojae]|eukprot:XP_009529105.1 hypothetical protein PHYSODRAFT_301900 [Phytophthora sojae]